MSRIAQLFDSRQWSLIASANAQVAVKAAAIVLVALPLAACGAGGFSLEQAEVDRTILTSSTPASVLPVDQERASDQATIRNAVSSADIQELGGQAVPWANSDTGSRGSITELAESRDNGQLCRRFTASRESFDGVALFKGEVCLAGAGAWRMQDFKAL
ncbi:RT0821/Lpp0805 family surface protein [Mesorhizobium escarrei]|uniref:17kDa_Anti_2 domain-containing protein n=1 Tax=Mesorhizobium escarrei TaxID=666018 RepID=A0ABM9DZ04_9HYPH|nr:RT0821/Lpp0805 family surface protein [Mesorhizobium escarrei]CAH2401893.1 17kDa_Anti_2 domain-containing protein [Mesorhizobium escarrei]